MKELKEMYPEMAGLDYLAVAPSLHSRPNTLLILAILKPDSYALSLTIQESIEDWIESDRNNKLYVLNSVDMEKLYKNKTIDEEEYNRIKYCSIRLDEHFSPQTDDELQKQFEEKYKKFQASKEKGEEEENIKELAQSDEDLFPKEEEEEENTPELSQSQKDFWYSLYYGDIDSADEVNFQKETVLYSQKNLETMWAQFEEFDPEEEEKETEASSVMQDLKDEERKDLSYLKGLADKYYYPGIRKIDCENYIGSFRKHSGLKENEGNKLLRFILENWKTCNGGVSIQNLMAIIKVMLGVDPQTNTTDQIEISFDPLVDNINAQDEHGRTALHLGANSAGGAIYWLLRLKANPLIKDKKGDTFLEYIPPSWHIIKKELEQFVNNQYKMNEERIDILSGSTSLSQFS